MLRSGCDHADLVDFDSSGRRFCTSCGEVLDSSESLTQVEFEAKPEFQIIPKLSSYSRGVSHGTAELIDAVCEHCEKSSGFFFPPILKQQVMALIDSYLAVSGSKTVYSYEDLVRTAMLIVLRRNGSAVPASRIIPRFDTKQSPAFRLLKRLGDKLNVVLPHIEGDVLARQAVELMAQDLVQRGVFLGKDIGGLTEKAAISAKQLLDCLVECQQYPGLIKLSHAIACAHFCVHHAIDFHSGNKKGYPVVAAIRANNAIQYSKAIYRDSEIVKRFAKKSCLDIGIPEKAFLENINRVTAQYKSKQELTNRIRDISQ